MSSCTLTPYEPEHAARSLFLEARGLRHHLWVWGDLACATEQQPVLVLAHGWMDVGASFQFMVDELRQWPQFSQRPIVALDWRGFGQTDFPQGDRYFSADYLGDLDALLDQLSPQWPVDLVGHSMGGNVTTIYVGTRPERIRRLVNLEGFGMPATQPQEAPGRYVKWLNELKKPARMKDYASLQEVAGRLQATNPRLSPDFALWLAQHWAHEEGGRWVINADPAHKRSQPLLYQAGEVLEFLKRITMPMLFVEGEQTLYFNFYQGRYTREEFVQRMALVPQLRTETLRDAGHMLHHDQPKALAALLADFLGPERGALRP